MEAKLKFFFTLVFAFLLIVPLGTLLHEIGHYLVGIFFFEDVSIQKASTHYGDYKYSTNEEFAYFLATIGGPVSTLLISCVGIHFLKNPIFQKISFSSYPIKSIIKIIIAFFLSREVLISLQLIFSKGISNADEYKIPSYLNINIQLFNVLLFIISTAICFYILNKSVEKSSQILFLFSAVIGCGIGYWIWFTL